MTGNFAFNINKAFIYLLFICVVPVFGQKKIVYNGILNSDFKTVIIEEDKKISFYDDINEAEYEFWNQSFAYKTIKKNNFTYFLLKNETYDNTIMVLKSDYGLFLYGQETSECLFSGFSIPTLATETVFVPSQIYASSELKEKNIVYSSSNLLNVNLESPWCEGKEGNGINERPCFEVNAKKLIIMTGYISFNKPYLFRENSRPKKIEIVYKELQKTECFELEDTPNPQIINLCKNYNGEIELIIKDVYSGTKYNDTCISSIICKYGD